MTSKNFLSPLISLFMIGFIIAGCSFLPAAPTATPTATTTSTPLPTLALATSTSTPIPPTSTPLPTATATIPPSVTPVTATLTLPVTLEATDLPEFACDMISNHPRDDTEFKKGDDFDIKWTIINTGSAKWKADTILTYQEGPQMTTKTKIILGEIKPGQKIEVSMDATAPNTSGRQVMLWAVTTESVDGDSIIWMCYPYTRIVVK